MVRDRSRRRRGLAALLLATSPGWIACAALGAATRPNVVLITADTLRADRLGAYGYTGARTPAIDSLARIGVRFDRASTPFPRTTPALASLMTGLWPQHHGSREVSDPFTHGTTLAEVLGANGYAAFGVSANWVAGRKQNMQKGFRGFISMKRMQTDDRGGFVTERALKLARLAPPEKPLFLWAHYMDPHFPYNPPKAFKDVPPGERCKKIMRAISARKLRLAVVQGNRGRLGEQTLGDCAQLYDAEIAYMDSQIGRLLKGLEEAGRLENVILVFTSDHGEAFGDAGLYYEHGSTVHEAVLRVPLFIAAPGVAPGVDEQTIRLEDLMPTILGLAGIPKGQWPETDGADQGWRLRKRARGPRGEEPVALAESGSALLLGTLVEPFEGQSAEANCVHGPRFSLCTRPQVGTGLYDRREDPRLTKDVSKQHPQELAVLRAARERWTVGEARQRSARRGRFKLVERPRLEGGYSRALYDLATDPAEQVDVGAQHPEVAAALATELSAWSASIPSQAPPPVRDEEQLEMLRALGYVD
jgi:arylsulfatase